MPKLRHAIFDYLDVVDDSTTIKGKLLDYAIDTLADGDSPQQVATNLGNICCEYCIGPAPIYNHDIASEIAEHWLEIQEAIDECEDATGEYWAPKNGQFLAYLWFAYEWHAANLSDRIENAVDLDGLEA